MRTAHQGQTVPEKGVAFLGKWEEKPATQKIECENTDQTHDIITESQMNNTGTELFSLTDWTNIFTQINTKQSCST